MIGTFAEIAGTIFLPQKGTVGWSRTSNGDAGVLPASAFVEQSWEPPFEAHTLPAAHHPSVSPRVASAAPAGSFKSVNRKLNAVAYELNFCARLSGNTNSVVDSSSATVHHLVCIILSDLWGSSTPLKKIRRRSSLTA